MNIEDFNYDLPEELIAQTPLKERTDSKLLVFVKLYIWKAIKIISKIATLFVTNNL